jgi:hypothetical protein
MHHKCKEVHIYSPKEQRCQEYSSLYKEHYSFHKSPPENLVLSQLIPNSHIHVSLNEEDKSRLLMSLLLLIPYYTGPKGIREYKRKKIFLA